MLRKIIMIIMLVKGQCLGGSRARWLSRNRSGVGDCVGGLVYQMNVALSKCSSCIRPLDSSSTGSFAMCSNLQYMHLRRTSKDIPDHR